MLRAMSRTKLLLILVPVGHAIMFGAYFLFSGDAAGTAMSVIFAIAMGLMIYILLPTVRDIGPTAPVDPAWAERDHAQPVELAEH
jgi:hypothetical protein